MANVYHVVIRVGSQANKKKMREKCEVGNEVPAPGAEPIEGQDEPAQTKKKKLKVKATEKFDEYVKGPEKFPLEPVELVIYLLSFSVFSILITITPVSNQFKEHKYQEEYLLFSKTGSRKRYQAVIYCSSRHIIC